MKQQSILIVVDGGVAYVVEDTVPKDVEVEIIDFDNLQDLGDSTPPRFSDHALAYIERQSKGLAVTIKSKRPPVP
jgi:hypothetical protein